MATVAATYTIVCLNTTELNNAKAYFDNRIATVGDVTSYTVLVLTLTVICAFPNWTP